MSSLSVAVIGSFKQYYSEVVAAVVDLRAAGFKVNSPPISYIINPGADFVRFEADPPQMSDHEIQAATLRNILESDVVFVVAPGGYIGRTTCYELGHVQQKGIPVCYSEVPLDLPIDVSSDSICRADRLYENFYRITGSVRGIEW